MLEGGWLQVFQRVPPQYQDTLSVVSVTGTELVIQQVYKLESDFVVLRARTAGTLDGGRVILVPYSQIDFLAFNRRLTEDEVTEIFNAPFEAVTPVFSMPTVAAGPAKSLPPSAPPVHQHAPVAASLMESGPGADAEVPPAEGGPKPGQISKTILLARLRERLAEKSK